MGTSTSSTGPGPRVPLVPPWVQDLDPLVSPPDFESGEDPTSPDQQPSTDPDVQNSQPNFNGDDDATDAEQQPPDAPTVQVPSQEPIAPTARFGGARRNLNQFARTGSSDDMRRGLGQYINKGYGGARTATHRMSNSARTAGVLFGSLSSAADRLTTASNSFDLALLEGSSADEIMDALVEAVRPVDGTLDTEVSRGSIRDALSDLLGRFPDADLLNLSEDQLLYVVECYLALDVYGRFSLDLGKNIQDNAPNFTVALTRLKDVKNYIKETVSEQFRSLKQTGLKLDVRRIGEMARKALENTFDVFEEYVT